jgi:hypothetical protein
VPICVARRDHTGDQGNTWTFRALLIDMMSFITVNKYDGVFPMLKFLRLVSPLVSSKLYTGYIPMRTYQLGSEVYAPLAEKSEAASETRR